MNMRPSKVQSTATLLTAGQRCSYIPGALFQVLNFFLFQDKIKAEGGGG